MWIYLAIFLAKNVEVSLMTLRTVMVTRGERLYAALIGIVEVSIWLVLMGTIITSLQEDPLRVAAYALGFASGVFWGSLLEEKIGLGLVTIHVIADIQDGRRIASCLRQRNIAVTHLKGEGRDEAKSVLMVHIRRRRKKEAVRIVRDTCAEAFVSVYDVKNIAGGYGLKK